MLYPPIPYNCNMDQDIDLTSTLNSENSDRLTLPPISSYLTSRSWPPSSTNLQLLSPSAVSTASSNASIHDKIKQNDPWSPIPNEHQQKIDYFSLNKEHNNQHHRQHSLPQLYTQNDARYSQHKPNNILSSSYTTTTIENKNTSLELVLTPTSSPTLRNIEHDIEQVIQHCNSLVDNMSEKKHIVIDNQQYFSDASIMQPWLDDMIRKANEVLNALLRLRKHQMAAEQARKYRSLDHRSYENTLDLQDNDGWSTLNNPGSSSIGPNRLRKRGKRPVFQGRCHSCHISETPEWRRGPDGARTLCNACGLHYAKLTKKKNKQEDIKKEDTQEDKTNTSI